MYLPYIDYSEVKQQCILAIDGPPEFSPILNSNSKENSALIIGQRFMAKYTFYALTDRDKRLVYTGIEGGNSTDLFSEFYVLSYIILGIIVFLLILLSYLIWLRNRRIRNDKWLQEHQEEIFAYA
jgi:hypothetical protein